MQQILLEVPQLGFPGVSYLDALDHMHKLNPGTVLTVLLVVYFCMMQQILLEVPLLGYIFAPEPHARHDHPVQNVDGPQGPSRRHDRRRRDRRDTGRQRSDHPALSRSRPASALSEGGRVIVDPGGEGSRLTAGESFDGVADCCAFASADVCHERE
jgi:hypothetical protein